jgi:hypothetical protein
MMLKLVMTNNLTSDNHKLLEFSFKGLLFLHKQLALPNDPS